MEKRNFKLIEFTKASPKVKSLIKKIETNRNKRLILEVESNKEVLIEFKNKFLKDKKNIFIVVGNNSKLTVVDSHQNFKGKAGDLRIYLITQANSQVDYLIKSNKLPNYESNYFGYPGRDAKLNWYLVGRLNHDSYNFNVSVNHLKQGSSGNIFSAVDFSKKSKSVINLISNHQATDSLGDIIFKGLGQNQSKAKIEGLIGIGKKARNTNSYLQQDVLLISEQSGIDTQPNLEILNNEVKASHGATVSNFDEKALFYLKSRGLNNKEAKSLMIKGFLNSITDKIENELVVEQFKAYWK